MKRQTNYNQSVNTDDLGLEHQAFSNTNDLIAATLGHAPLVESLPLCSVQAQRRTLRKHGAAQRRQMKASLQKYGQVLPILIDGNGAIIDGHLIYETLGELGYASVLAIRITHLTADIVRKLRLSLNKLGETAEWNPDELRLELKDLIVLDPDPAFNIAGFETAELDLLLSPDTKSRQTDEDDILPARSPSQTPICQSGDLWQMGPHRLICGNALEAETYETLLDGRKAVMVQSDPPFNVRISGHVSGLGRTRHREFAMGSGEMSKTEFQAFLAKCIGLARNHAIPGAILQFFMDWRHMPELLGASDAEGLALINLCVWVKDNGGMGSLYRSRHELVFIFRKEGAPHINNVELGRHGRYRTNVWEYPGMNSLHEDRDASLAYHPTVKPIAMIADALCDSTEHGDAVLDPFAGSGTIFLAAERTHRHAFGIEIDPVYCDTAMDRWERSTGFKAIHDETGLTRTALAKVRGKKPARKRSRIASQNKEAHDD